MHLSNQRTITFYPHLCQLFLLFFLPFGFLYTTVPVLHFCIEITSCCYSFIWIIFVVPCLFFSQWITTISTNLYFIIVDCLLSKFNFKIANYSITPFHTDGFYYTSMVLLYFSSLNFYFKWYSLNLRFVLMKKQPKLLLFNYCFLYSWISHYLKKRCPDPFAFRLNSRNSATFIVAFLTF
jgi:hypothetical protein